MIYSYEGDIFMHCIDVVLYRGISRSFAGQNLMGKTQNGQNLIEKALQKAIEHR